METNFNDIKGRQFDFLEFMTVSIHWNLTLKIVTPHNRIIKIINPSWCASMQLYERHFWMSDTFDSIYEYSK